jgi:epoxyqueuosine reductase QueG
MNDHDSWPRCVCGHIAQAHNVRRGEEPRNYGCDQCQCPGYRYPDHTDPELIARLEARRNRALGIES